VNECGPLAIGGGVDPAAGGGVGGAAPAGAGIEAASEDAPPGRGLHSFTSELNLSNLGHVYELSRVIRWTEELKLS